MKNVKKRKEKEEKTTLRVAVYSHASANTEGNGPDIQDAALVEMVDGNPDWTLAGIYAEDPVVSMKRKRPQFLRLMKDCDNGLVDCVLCRSIAILIRNDRKEIPYLRHLQDLDVHLVFHGDGVESGSDVFELLLTVLEALTEGKTWACSENFTKNSRDRALNGATPFTALYGFRQSETDYEIVEEEAKTVRLIFDYYEHGMVVKKIAAILSEKNIPPPGAPFIRWHYETIQIMIENEKYVGDYNAQRYYSRDPLENRRYRNKGFKPTVYHKDHHPAIISREQFDRCKTISDLRAWDKPLQYPFGEYLKCPYCGRVLYRRQAPSRTQYCCEGEGACRKFSIMKIPLHKAILGAYENIDLKAVLKKAGMRDYSIAIEAEKMLRVKEKHPAFETVDFWWLDDLVSEIQFGKHSHTASELEAMGEGVSAIDDRTISIYWRCGVVSTVSSGVIKDCDDPRSKAERWDAFILSHPDRYPQLIDEVRSHNDAETSGSQ